MRVICFPPDTLITPGRYRYRLLRLRALQTETTAAAPVTQARSLALSSLGCLAGFIFVQEKLGGIVHGTAAVIRG